MESRGLVVGIAGYQRVRPLPAAVLNDARAVHAAITDSKRGLFPSATLLDQSTATRDGLRAALEELRKGCTPDTQVLIYVSSHGGSIATGPRAGCYLLPIDARGGSPDELADSSISSAEVTTWLRELPAACVLLVLDCCHAGGIGEPKHVSAGLEFFKDGLSAGQVGALSSRDRVILASSRGEEQSWVLPNGHHSLFTKHLIAGLSGEAVRGDSVSVFDLFDYVQRRVVEDGRQHPVFRGELTQNFAVARGHVLAAAPREFEYDAFVTYAAADEAFVFDVLLPRLEQSGMKALTVDTDTAGVGGFRVTTIAEGIKRSSRTIAVISPDYVKDQLGQFSSAFAVQHGVEQAQARLVPLIVRPTPHMPSLLSMLVGVDFTHARLGGDKALERVVNALRIPVPSL